MQDYTRWWQYIIILTIVSVVIVVILEVFFVYVPVFRIESQVYHTTDLLNSAGNAAVRIEQKIDTTLTILEPLIVPVVKVLCEAICGTIQPNDNCPTGTFEYCQQFIGPTGVTGTNSSLILSSLTVPLGPSCDYNSKDVSATINYYQQS